MPFEVTLEDVATKKIIGMPWQGSNTSEIPQLWDEFVPRIVGLTKIESWGISYGACKMVPGLAEGEFCYLAAIGWDGQLSADWLEVWDIPAEATPSAKCPTSKPSRTPTSGSTALGLTSRAKIEKMMEWTLSFILRDLPTRSRSLSTCH